MSAIRREHLLREGQPPWRQTEGLLTECGKPIVGSRDDPTYNGATVYTRAELAAFIREHGQRRAVLVYCVTCVDAAQRWKEWAEDPNSCINRESGPYAPTAETLRRELFALADLVRLHEEEFDQLLRARDETINLADRRREKKRQGLM